MTAADDYYAGFKDPFTSSDNRIDTLVRIYEIDQARGGSDRPFKVLLGAMNNLRLESPKSGDYLRVTTNTHYVRNNPRIEHDLFSTVRGDERYGQRFMSLRYNLIQVEVGARCHLTEHAKKLSRDPLELLHDYLEHMESPLDGLAHCAVGAINTLMDLGYITLTAATPQSGACSIIFTNPHERYRLVSLSVDADVLKQDREHHKLKTVQ